MLIKNRLYVIIDDGVCAAVNKEIKSCAEEIISGGCSFFQLRIKKRPPREFLKLAQQISSLKNKNLKLIINDRIDICLVAGGDGVHIGKDDFLIEEAKKLLQDRILGYTINDLKELKNIIKFIDLIDYISVGPIYYTPLKSKIKPHGVEFIKKIKEILPNKFLVAVGGIDEKNFKEVIASGADAVAVSRAILLKENIKEAVANFIYLLNQ